jgi:prepilin-type N-terminal cleavage/methylation domain-containing protein
MSHYKKKGFTLIELLITLFVSSIIMTGLFKLSYGLLIYTSDKMVRQNDINQEIGFILEYDQAIINKTHTKNSLVPYQIKIINDSNIYYQYKSTHQFDTVLLPNKL